MIYGTFQETLLQLKIGCDSIWMDGFCNCLLFGRRSHDDEEMEHILYTQGRLAGEQYLRAREEARQLAGV